MRKEYEEQLYNMSIADSQNREEDKKLREKYLDYLKKICRNEIVYPEPSHVYELVDFKRVLNELNSMKIDKNFMTEKFNDYGKNTLEIIINNWKFYYDTNYIHLKSK